MEMPNEFFHIAATVESGASHKSGKSYTYSPETDGFILEADLREYLDNVLSPFPGDRITGLVVTKVSAEVPARDVTRDVLEDYIRDRVAYNEADPADIPDFTLPDGFRTYVFACEMYPRGEVA